MIVFAGEARSKATEVDSGTADFEALFEEHWPRVHALVFRIVGDGDEAEDVALEAFRRLHGRMAGPGSTAGIASLRGWLYRVATNLGLNALRDRGRRERHEMEAGRAMLEATPPQSPAAELERAEERALARRVLSQLKPRSARLLVLRHAGLTYAEVAAAVGVSPASVGTLLARAEREFEERYRALEGGHDASDRR